MESRNKYSMCRLCLCENECFVNIFEENDWNGYVAATVITDLLQFQVSDRDGYPHVICSSCLNKVTDFKVFKEQCQTSRVTYDNVFATANTHEVERITVKVEPMDEEEEEDDEHEELNLKASDVSDDGDEEYLSKDVPVEKHCSTPPPVQIESTESVREDSSVVMRKKYTAQFKLKVVEFAEKSNNRVASRKFGMSEKNIRDWRKCSEMLRNMPKNKCANRGRAGKWLNLESKVSERLKKVKESGKALTRVGIQQCAQEESERLGIVDFKASLTWVHRFMKKNGVTLKRKKAIKPLPEYEYVTVKQEDTGTAGS